MDDDCKDHDWIWLDGALVRSVEFRLPSRDRGFTHGLGLFETILAIDGRPRCLARHMARLEESCERLRMCPPAAESLAQAITELLQRNHLTTKPTRVRVSVTAGEGSLTDITATKPHVWITANPLVMGVPVLRIALSPWVRNERSPLAGLKCSSYAENLCALDEAKRRGFDEALQFNTRGEVCEATMANVFLVRDGVVLTPALDSGCLPGVMRGLVLELCSSMGIQAREARLSEADLTSAEEIFLTSSLRGVMPVATCGGMDFQAPGEFTRRLLAAVRDFQSKTRL